MNEVLKDDLYDLLDLMTKIHSIGMATMDIERMNEVRSFILEAMTTAEEREPIQPQTKKKGRNATNIDYVAEYMMREKKKIMKRGGVNE